MATHASRVAAAFVYIAKFSEGQFKFGISDAPKRRITVDYGTLFPGGMLALYVFEHPEARKLEKHLQSMLEMRGVLCRHCNSGRPSEVADVGEGDEHMLAAVTYCECAGANLVHTEFNRERVPPAAAPNETRWWETLREGYAANRDYVDMGNASAVKRGRGRPPKTVLLIATNNKPEPGGAVSEAAAARRTAAARRAAASTLPPAAPPTSAGASGEASGEARRALIDAFKRHLATEGEASKELVINLDDVSCLLGIEKKHLHQMLKRQCTREVDFVARKATNPNKTVARANNYIGVRISPACFKRLCVQCTSENAREMREILLNV